MDLTAAPLEDILDQAVPAAPVITVWLAGHTLTAARLVSWCRASGIVVCRGGSGFTDDDVHYLRAAEIQGLTLRLPAVSSRPETDRLSQEIRESLRQAAGYPLSLAIRPDAFSADPAPLAAWVESIVEAVLLLEPFHEAMQAQVDQILLREGATVAVLGGSTLILEALPESIPTPDQIRTAVEPLLI